MNLYQQGSRPTSNQRYTENEYGISECENWDIERKIAAAAAAAADDDDDDNYLIEQNHNWLYL